MKKNTTFLILIFLFLGSKSFAQANVYFENDPQWTINKTVYSGMDCSGNDYYYDYYINGDSAVNSLTYKKVYQKGVRYQINTSCVVDDTAFFDYSNPQFLIRSIDKKMFVRFPNTANEELLHDFNLSIGDTLPESYTYNSWNSTYDIVVLGIDSINTSNGYLKVFNLTNNYKLFEGIGSTSGLIESVFPMFLSGGHQLLCYSLNSSSVVNPTSTFCNISAGLESNQYSKILTNAPNPFSNNTKFTFDKFLTNAQFKLFNASGSLMKIISFTGTDFVLEREQFNAGLYYYEIEVSKEQAFRGKLVITD